MLLRSDDKFFSRTPFYAKIHCLICLLMSEFNSRIGDKRKFAFYMRHKWLSFDRQNEKTPLIEIVCCYTEPLIILQHDAHSDSLPFRFYSGIYNLILKN